MWLTTDTIQNKRIYRYEMSEDVKELFNFETKWVKMLKSRLTSPANGKKGK